MEPGRKDQSPRRQIDPCRPLIASTPAILVLGITSGITGGNRFPIMQPLNTHKLQQTVLRALHLPSQHEKVATVASWSSRCQVRCLQVAIAAGMGFLGVIAFI